MPISDPVRQAAAEHIERRRKDRKCQDTLERLMDENREALARLAQ